jgi:hypothetical protein
MACTWQLESELNELLIDDFEEMGLLDRIEMQYVTATGTTL